MATNKGTTITGYVFPNPPANWSPEEKRFVLALRGLFDILFQKTRGLKTDYEKNDYNALANKPAISGQILSGNKSLSDIGIHNVNEISAGLMTPALLGTLNETSAEVDYLMTQSVLAQINEIKGLIGDRVLLRYIEGTLRVANEDRSREFGYAFRRD